ncbi:MAG: thymidine phosphorylase [Chloroflexi bacterium]|jgi:pyrimidine-nucleoside phosphorylase|nr:thymidine phosphorylase [Chloroflexota bacterium]HOT24926.1 thymidine phosphorylase [Anaerolineaceae bacterium]HQH57519.1 thymidine phosphorylase [Anaerolineaceae bacterium]HQK03045.1 thymidine phosphorylase [Anaerolineaceae bacterium]HQL27042.1 thymidine phosphorylase [Anaerolineaceae bacterium]
MRAVDIIIKKRDKEVLSKAEIDFLIENYTRGTIPDYQMSAWAMAVLLNGMTDQEITDLTMAMARSGDMLDLSQAVDIAVDKHSTGGVGDKTTLTVAPLVAACGLPVGKMSGRGLGFSGGTIDKLEAIPGFQVDLSTQQFINQLKEHGIVLTGQSADLAPADGKLYALRDVTGTVQSIPLIASSVMSKKIAAGAHAIVLDVKVGQGAFMRTLEEARQLAEVMVSIGRLSGRRVIAVLSPMDQPLGNAVGNALELKEAVEMLHGVGPEDYRYHCLHLAAYMLILGGLAKDIPEGIGMAERAINDGSGFAKFRELVLAQGGDVRVIDDLKRLPKAAFVESVYAENGGWASVVDAKEVGETSVALGAGREQKGDLIDQAVGIIVKVKVGDAVDKGQVLFEVHANDPRKLQQAKERLKNAVKIVNRPVEKPPYFHGVIGI